MQKSTKPQKITNNAKNTKSTKQKLKILKYSNKHKKGPAI